jgi:hypothetical protein
MESFVVRMSVAHSVSRPDLGDRRGAPPHMVRPVNLEVVDRGPGPSQIRDEFAAVADRDDPVVGLMGDEPSRRT